MQTTSLDCVQVHYLDNGLKILIESNHHAPVVSLQIGIKVGSVMEKNEEAGLSHVLEHMVFKGTTSYKPGEIASLVEANGGELNAYTAFDQTVYYINLPKKNWILALRLLKEMMFDAIIDPVELSHELEVILEELKRSKDNPRSVLSEHTFSKAFPHHNYGRPIIGYENTIKSFTPGIVKDYYQRWYHPANMVLGICGDVSVDEALETVKNIFSHKPIHKSPVYVPFQSINPPSSFSLHGSPFESSFMNIAFPIPDIKHPHVPTLDLLSRFLGEGETSLLEQNVRKKKELAFSIYSYAYTPKEAGLFFISTNHFSGKTKELIKAIGIEIETVQKNLCDPMVLERMRSDLKSSLYYTKETCEGCVRKWMMYETTAGSLNFEKEYLERLDQVKPHDIQHVANTYLNWSKAGINILHPHKEKIKLTKDILISLAKKKNRIQKKYKQEQRKDLTKIVFANSITLLLKPSHRLPLISVKMASMGGLGYENKNTNGIYQLMTSLLDKGTTKKNALQISEICEEIGGSINGVSGRDSWGLSADFLSDKKQLGLDLFLDVFLNPTFERVEVKKEKDLTLEAIRQENDHPAQLAFKGFAKTLFPNHSYGMPAIGTKNTVQKIDAEALKALNKKCQKSPFVFSVVGDFNPEEIISFFEAELMHLKSSFRKQACASVPLPAKSITTIVHKDKMQSHLVIGFGTPGLKHPDRYALEVLSNVLSGQGGRLFLELRDRRSLAYTVTSMTSFGLSGGYFATYIASDPSKLEEAQNAMVAQLNKICGESISDSELDRSKNYIIGNYDLDLQKGSSIAASLVYSELYGLGFDAYLHYAQKIAAVTLADISRVSKKYLNFKKCITSIVCPET
ncbi:MAG: hypothetical protein A3G32_08180 [Deltaproteobacteria bacterium RIFCSPLOWO2_12_FULL_40_28]|nr:MAG: hypothetical protein A3C45_00880 [Deltaproteobacteria bacterium RIFCSPHIGHO2_02_FULL_40_28]OGQ20887.1 MAG: hypothetical protein A3E27_03545 [Deltaproteobacteria bacterium RIFCSPHIGHO2_12_FULL_40_32]OGQ39288.1 MAG: hypothetical protein A3I69_04905 [Deltaproteobacteria bacterium RIFCSPLOWO2_02_FULL_40_36]OGQ54569.1 MAG: hypothetical protein A3G32_08180 [Deltaproteobacteria bacterium RIFCSPLOWO2_12_FULL_40_28]